MSSSSQENARGSTHPGFSLMGSLPAPPYCADEKTMPTSRQIHVAIALLAPVGGPTLDLLCVGDEPFVTTITLKRVVAARPNGDERLAAGHA